VLDRFAASVPRGRTALLLFAVRGRGLRRARPRGHRTSRGGTAGVCGSTVRTYGARTTGRQQAVRRRGRDSTRAERPAVSSRCRPISLVDDAPTREMPCEGRQRLRPGDLRRVLAYLMSGDDGVFAFCRRGHGGRPAFPWIRAAEWARHRMPGPWSGVLPGRGKAVCALPAGASPESKAPQRSRPTKGAEGVLTWPSALPGF